jgi:DNA (cytosine-5)-methyltransferase 1
MKIGSLCTGYGGLDMAVEAFFNAETVWCSEFDKYASQIVDARIKKPNLGDLTKIDWTQVEPIDILTAGYPCQPFSHAGQRKGTNDTRHIFPYIAEAIEVLRPKYIIMENVRGHLTLGFEEVLETLTKLGYDTKWQIVRASDVGAPHQRARLFIIAQPSNAYGKRSNLGEFQPTQRDKRKSQFESCQCCSIISDTNNKHFSHNGAMSQLGRRFASRCQMRMQRTPNPLDLEGKLNAEFVEYMMGLPKGWVTDVGLSRSQQLKILGNGVVPQQAEYAIHQLLK